MLDLGPISEDEMVLAFLRGEIDSPRHGFRGALGPHAHLVDRPDLADALGNANRKNVLQQTRGYRGGAYLFQGFPPNVTWRRVRLDPGEVTDLRYANHPTWVTLSGGTRRVGDGAANVATVQTGDETPDHVKALAAAVQQGRRYPELIAVEAADGGLVLVEGHTRATAYVVAGLNEPVDVIVGTSPQMAGWVFY